MLVFGLLLGNTAFSMKQSELKKERENVQKIVKRQLKFLKDSLSMLQKSSFPIIDENITIIFKKLSELLALKKRVKRAIKREKRKNDQNLLEEIELGTKELSDLKVRFEVLQRTAHFTLPQGLQSCIEKLKKFKKEIKEAYDKKAQKKYFELKREFLKLVRSLNNFNAELAFWRNKMDVPRWERFYKKVYNSFAEIREKAKQVPKKEKILSREKITIIKEKSFLVEKISALTRLVEVLPWSIKESKVSRIKSETDELIKVIKTIPTENDTLNNLVNQLEKISNKISWVGSRKIHLDKQVKENEKKIDKGEGRIDFLKKMVVKIQLNIDKEISKMHELGAKFKTVATEIKNIITKLESL